MRLEMIAAGSMIALASATASADVINSWINWDAPSGYGSSNGSPGYDYATELLGTIAMPGTSTVYVKLTGEIAQSTTGDDPDPLVLLRLGEVDGREHREHRPPVQVAREPVGCRRVRLHPGLRHPQQQLELFKDESIGGHLSPEGERG